MSDWQTELGRELRESPIPPHHLDYLERIRERIRETDRTAGSPPRDIETGATSRRVASLRTARAKRRFAAVIAVAVALLAAVALTWSGLPGVHRSAPAAATASSVLDRVQHAMSALGSIGGDVVEYGSVRGRPFAHKVGSFVFTAEGDYRIEQTELGVEYTYDSLTREAHRVTREDGVVVYGETSSDLPDPGPFFGPWMGASQVLDRSVAAYARAVIAELEPGVPVTPVSYEGRTAWSIAVPEHLVGGGSNGSVRIIVDVASGYPLLVEHWTAEGDVSGTRIEKLRVDVATDRSRFGAASDIASKLVPLSERYRQLTLPQAAAFGVKVPGHDAAGSDRRGHLPSGDAFAPLMPGWTPKGFQLDGVTGAVNGAVMGRYTAVTGGDEVGSLTVVLTYRRGFDRFCVISRWRQVNRPGSDDPFAEDVAASPSVQSARLVRGAVRGSTAQVVIDLPDWPHLYITTGPERRVTVSVAGDLTRDELVRIASSLQPISSP